MNRKTYPNVKEGHEIAKLLETSIIIQKTSFNVPVVCDGLKARIGDCRARLGLANCGCNEPPEPLGDLGEWNPGAAEWWRNAYNPVMCSRVFYQTNFNPSFSY